ncbi:MAG: SRPBCC family protein [Planctomycetaceae bacterium]|nr:SRPBCC family protein [Planctomycetaceae bacterium]
MAPEQTLEYPTPPIRAEAVPPTLPRGGEMREKEVQPEHRPATPWETDAHAAATALGLFSIGLGAAEIIFPRAIAGWLGIRRRQILLRALGAREIATGIGLLSGRGRATWLWSRVLGDAIDLGLLAAASQLRHAKSRRIAAVSAAVAAVTAGDVVASIRASHRAVHTRQSITVNASPETAYQFWRCLQNLPRFMRHVELVRPEGERRSHWVVSGPGGLRLEWDAELTDDQPNRLLAWRSLPGSPVRHVGSVEFERAPGERGTVVRAEVEYAPPAGRLGSKIATLLGRDPSQELREDLRRFKQLLETGEIITTEGQPAGRSQGTSWRYDATVRGEREYVRF